ncbi:type II toxin-antitoxin system HicA family toxin [Cyanobacteria bacterium FACHB-63]|nr:type II toxin-antitoxin system HicA family toxin [Cyanobacteria bacterium FACHB-63]
MKLPRDLSGSELAKRLKRFEYVIDHQTGSHIRLTTQQNGEHHITIPAHDPLKVGTLSAILRDIAEHLDLSRDDLIAELFQK